MSIVQIYNYKEFKVYDNHVKYTASGVVGSAVIQSQNIRTVIKCVSMASNYCLN